MRSIGPAALLACLSGYLGAAGAQSAAQIGGRPPKAVETELCTIADVFGEMAQITTDPDCQAGCAGGTGVCPASWFPGSEDECSPQCGRIFEPFWCAHTYGH